MTSDQALSSLRVLLPAVALTLACAPAPSGEAPAPGDELPADTGEPADDGDDGLVLDSCEEDPAAFPALSAELTDMATVFSVTWQTAEPVDSWLEYAVDPGETRTTPVVEAGGEQAELLRGLPASHEVLVRVVDEEGRCSEALSLETASLPYGLPGLEQAGSDVVGTGFVSVPMITPSGSHLTIVDPQGRYVWALNVMELPWRLEFARDHGGLIVLHQAPSADTRGHILRFGWDGRLQSRVDVTGLHTDFVEGPDGAYYALAWDLRIYEHEGEERKILGDRVVRIDPDSGQVDEIWSTYDDWAPDLDEGIFHTGLYGDDPEVEEWTHGNGISFDEAHGQLLVSLSDVNTVVALEPETGEVAWTLGELEGSVDWGRSEQPLENPHSVYRGPDDEIIVFNRMDFDGSECSQVDTFSVDEEDHEASLLTSYESPDCYSVYYLGMARPIAQDRTLVVWTTSGRIEQLDADQQVRWSLQAELGAGMAFSDHRVRLYAD